MSQNKEKPSGLSLSKPRFSLRRSVVGLFFITPTPLHLSNH